MKKLGYEALRHKIEEYFDHCSRENRPPTVTGLSLALGLSSREELALFTEEKQARLIRAALLTIENSAEEKLFSKEFFSGAKLFLEVNFSRWTGDAAEHFDPLRDLSASGTEQWAK